MPSSTSGAQPQPFSEREPVQTTPMTAVRREATLIMSLALPRQKKKITISQGKEGQLKHREVK